MKYLLPIILLAGCSYSPAEKKAFGLLVSSQLADAYTTNRYISIGGSELNPILDDHPSRDQVYLLKAGVVGMYWLLGEMYPEHREELFISGSVIGFGVAGYNYRLYEENK